MNAAKTTKIIDGRKYLSPAAVADALRISRITVNQRMKAGKIPYTAEINPHKARPYRWIDAAWLDAELARVVCVTPASGTATR